MFVNYAHRGASTYYPENTLSSFRAGVKMGANGIETDVHQTADGVLILFHDDTLDHVTDGKGRVTDFTYAELSRLRVKNAAYDRTDKILTLEEFLQHFSNLDLTFAIELKQPHIEKEIIDMLSRYSMQKKTILTSFDFDSIRRAKEYAPEYPVGLLFGPLDEGDPVEKLRSIGGEQLCPRADMLKAEMVRTWHEMGYSVRAWGVKTEQVMRDTYFLGVDGMTVNFPDKLEQLLREQPR